MTSPGSPLQPAFQLILNNYLLSQNRLQLILNFKYRESKLISQFFQQELPVCWMILTQKIVTFILLSFVYISFGIVALNASRNVVEINYRYDDDCIPIEFGNNKVEYIQTGENKKCSQTLTVPNDMKHPIYIYYQLNNFHQNHLRYLKNRSNDQLRDVINEAETGTCRPLHKDIGGLPIVPCGLVAWSLFNDTYSFSSRNLTIPVNKKGISWKSDWEHKFGSNVFPKNFQSRGQVGGARLDPFIPLSEQEDLMVWMRKAPLLTFRKLYGKIEVDLKKGDKIDVIIYNRYNTYSFNGEKRLVLSTTSFLGGKNDFLGIISLVGGGLWFLIALAFILINHFKPRIPGDPASLSWNQPPG
ncbi:putative ALA-interacting subunit 4 [Impatiens glandulifera]|uniref:putative ALA-interacting subunit 4 n=1 Tax=Impatiens glandulifera TaxID=253017 RepID=UPI001FB0882A|nr:putative ALA-interacting subunit 4 [Impatiens glandulifera]